MPAPQVHFDQKYQETAFTPFLADLRPKTSLCPNLWPFFDHKFPPKNRLKPYGKKIWPAGGDQAQLRCAAAGRNQPCFKPFNHFLSEKKKKK